MDCEKNYFRSETGTQRPKSAARSQCGELIYIVNIIPDKYVERETEKERWNAGTHRSYKFTKMFTLLLVLKLEHLEHERTTDGFFAVNY